MVKGANEIIEVMTAAKPYVGEHWQRSALGIADTHIRGGNVDLNPDTFRYENGIPRDRDTLAAWFIDVVDGLPNKKTAQVALNAARDWLNAPHMNDPALLKWRAERAARGPLGKVVR